MSGPRGPGLPGLALFVVLGAGAPARANPMDAFGLGSRIPAMGGAGTAAAWDMAANYYNPGALAASRTLSLDVGYLLASPHMSWNDRDAGVDSTHGLYAGLRVPGRIGRLPIAFGAVIFLPDDRLTRVKSEPASEPRFIYYDNRTQRLYLAANAALRVARGLYVGGGLVWMSRSQGQVTLNGQVGFPDPEASDLKLQMSYDLKAVRYPQAGVLWQPTGDLSFGLTYRHSFELDLDQTLRIEGNVGDVSAPIIQNGFVQVRSQSTDLFQPAQLAAGMAWRLRRRWLVSADLVYQRWSAFHNPGAQIKLDHDLGAFERLVHFAEVPPPQDPHFHDVLALHGGVELSLRRERRVGVLLRGGYAYEPSPVPDQFGETSFADSDKHTLSAGAGLVLRDLPFLELPLALDAYVALTDMVSRTTHKARATDPVGDFEAHGTVLATGLGLRIAF